MAADFLETRGSSLRDIAAKEKRKNLRQSAKSAVPGFSAHGHKP
jgi:hypothetical protein